MNLYIRWQRKGEWPELGGDMGFWWSYFPCLFTMMAGTPVKLKGLSLSWKGKLRPIKARATRDSDRSSSSFQEKSEPAQSILTNGFLSWLTFRISFFLPHVTVFHLLLWYWDKKGGSYFLDKVKTGWDPLQTLESESSLPPLMIRPKRAFRRNGHFLTPLRILSSRFRQSQAIFYG